MRARVRRAYAALGTGVGVDRMVAVGGVQPARSASIAASLPKQPEWCGRHYAALARAPGSTLRPAAGLRGRAALGQDGGMTKPGPADSRQVTVRLLGGVRRSGTWRVPARMVVVTLVGGLDADLTEAEFSQPEVSLIKVSVVGGVDLTVPAHVDVQVSGFCLLGGVRDTGTGQAAPTHVERERAGGAQTDDGAGWVWPSCRATAVPQPDPYTA